MPRNKPRKPPSARRNGADRAPELIGSNPYASDAAGRWWEIPLPIKLRNPLNRREHWWETSKLSQQEKLIADAQLNRVWRMPGRAHPIEEIVHVVLVRYAPREYDFGGLVASLKWVEDRVAAFLGRDDSLASGWKCEFRQERCARKYGVVVRLLTARAVVDGEVELGTVLNAQMALGG